jgi:hypothetical protein
MGHDMDAPDGIGKSCASEIDVPSVRLASAISPSSKEYRVGVVRELQRIEHRPLVTFCYCPATPTHLLGALGHGVGICVRRKPPSRGGARIWRRVGTSPTGWPVPYLQEGL